MYGKQPKQNTFGELGTLGEAMIASLGRQVAREIANLDSLPFKSNLLVADRAETMTAAVLVSVLPYADQRAAEDIISGVMQVDLLPAIKSDRRIQEALQS
jgi:hypothetical protein